MTCRCTSGVPVRQTDERGKPYCGRCGAMLTDGHGEVIRGP